MDDEVVDEADDIPKILIIIISLVGSKGRKKLFKILPDNAITVSHLRIGASSLVFVSYFEKLLVEKFLLMGLSDEFRRDLVITELATKLRKLGTLGTSAIEVRVSQRTTCCLPDNASVFVS